MITETHLIIASVSVFVGFLISCCLFKCCC